MSKRYVFLTVISLGLLMFAYTAVMGHIASGTAPKDADQQADLIVVSKAKKQLNLYRAGVIVRSYRISMGSNWDQGHKQREGDERTPEGHYLIDWRNPNSKAHLSLHISYPDTVDTAAAQKAGQDPGGNIMIHGLPNGWGFMGNLHHLINWTDGCIAVTNTEIQEIWSMVPNGTPIEIRGL